MHLYSYNIYNHLHTHGELEVEASTNVQYSKGDDNRLWELKYI